MRYCLASAKLLKTNSWSQLEHYSCFSRDLWSLTLDAYWKHLFINICWKKIICFFATRAEKQNKQFIVMSLNFKEEKKPQSGLFQLLCLSEKTIWRHHLRWKLWCTLCSAFFTLKAVKVSDSTFQLKWILLWQ